MLLEFILGSEVDFEFYASRSLAWDGVRVRGGGRKGRQAGSSNIKKKPDNIHSTIKIYNKLYRNVM